MLDPRSLASTRFFHRPPQRALFSVEGSLSGSRRALQAELVLFFGSPEIGLSYWHLSLGLGDSGESRSLEK